MEPLLYGVILRQTPFPSSAQGLNATTCRAQVKIGNEEADAIAKRLPERELLVECLCAQIGRALGLPIPRPMILMDAQRELWFGAQRLEHPDLRRESDAAHWAPQLAAWKYLPDACAFDGWIANDDRNQGNLLTNGLGDFWLIDHGHALPQGMRPDARCANQLLTFASAVNRERQSSLLEGLRSACAACMQLETGSNPPAGTKDMLEFLRSRAHVLWPMLRSEVTGNHELSGL